MRADARRGGTLALDRDPTLGDGVRHVFVLRVENGRGAYRLPPRAAARRGGDRRDPIDGQGSGRWPSSPRPSPTTWPRRLTESGLYAKEARAMVNTWTTSYFQTDGIRVLFVLPQSWTDAFIPMTIMPKPKQVVRVMVGRLELLSPEREQLAEAAVRDLAGPTRQAAARRSDSSASRAGTSSRSSVASPRRPRTTACGRSAGGCS